MPDPSTIPVDSPFADFGGPQGLIDLFTQLFGGGGTTTTGDTQSPEAVQAAQSLMAVLGPELTNNDFSNAAAERDSTGAIQSIIRQMTESGLPTITTGENAAGGYNSTAASLLKNDLATRTAEAGAAKLSATKTSYATARQGQIAQIINLIRTMATAHTQNVTTTQRNALLNQNNTRNAAAAAGAAALLRALTGKGNGGKAPTPAGKTPAAPKVPDAQAPNPGEAGHEDESLGLDMTNPNGPTGNPVNDQINNDDVLGLDLTGGDIPGPDTSAEDDLDHGGALGTVSFTGEVGQGDPGVIDLGALGDTTSPDFNFSDLLNNDGINNPGGDFTDPNAGNNNDGLDTTSDGSDGFDFLDNFDFTAGFDGGGGGDGFDPGE